MVAVCGQTSPIAAIGEFERSVDVGAGGGRRAEQLGQPSIIATSVATAASLDFMNPQGLDFAACLEVLTNHPVGMFGGATNAMWLDITWPTAEVGLGQHGAVEYLTRAARAADQLHSLHAFDLVLRFLALAAAEAGLGEHAHALVAYTEANLRPYRTQNPQQVWVQERLDQVLAGLPGRLPGPALPRGEIMRRITEIEAALT